MENKINIAEILKDCPKGMELDCTIYDDVTLYNIDDSPKREYPIHIKTKNGYSLDLTKHGTYSDTEEAKCIIFPKGKTTWEGFTRPFKDGDVIYTESFIAIFSHITEDGEVCYHCYYYINTKKFKAKRDFGIGNINYDEFRIATADEKAKLFQVIKDNGYKWNAETKTLEKLPKFKVGDRLIYIHDKEMYMNEPIYVKFIECNRYILNNGKYIPFYDQDDFELAPNKFDITKLKPFESKVLVRNSDYHDWCPAIFGCKLSTHTLYKYATMTENYYAQCIPYEGNEHLLGTTDDCDGYFKTWE